MDDDLELLTKVATLYHVHGLTQSQVGARLGLSRQTVGRMLTRARARGIVEVRIRSPVLFSADLEVRLEGAFGLAEAVVVRPADESDDAVKAALGEAAARVLERHLQAGDVVGLAWGSTLYEMVRRLRPRPISRVKVVQLNGSLVRNTHVSHAEYIVQHTAEVFGGESIMLAAPLMVDTRVIKESVLQDSRIASALALARRAQVAMFGIGAVSRESSLVRAGYVDQALLQDLREAGAVGEICGRFYDLSGRLCARDLGERTLAVELADLRTKRLAVGVAGGGRKVDAILGALAGRYCNVLITDAIAAEALLRRRDASAQGRGPVTHAQHGTVRGATA
ncbi:MAG: sugar-binding transcriptional regulator [Armatimonadota bacterium]|nr:sugar-binding transcriptional regulator [Armatimonadota bacterium]MDR7486359.1 sugar-binding transcriptional regulator [Armatimonadota bacterium]MDR7534236.1 sugar-binding transcriptional regulator [Armatimonadota bacterium]MDR7536748.1 sugar-binding transcriptional regulator [Armatimonadota bacterium]